MSRHYRVAVVSDTQVGSLFGLLPPDFTKRAGDRCEQNPGQKYLWRCWLDMCQRFRDLAPDVLVFNGDSVDGAQQAQRGTELCLPLLTDQEDAFVAAMEMLLAACPSRPALYLVQGTEYHEGKAAGHLEHAGRVLNAETYFGLGTGKYSREVLDLDVSGVILNFAHHISVMSGLYRATAPDREAVWSALAGKEGKMPKADALVRSHVHIFVHVEHATKHALITPAWQLQTRFMRKNSVYRMLPDLGYVWLEVEPQAKAQREDPIIVRKWLYDLPPFVTTKARLPEDKNEQSKEAATAV